MESVDRNDDVPRQIYPTSNAVLCIMHWILKVESTVVAADCQRSTYNGNGLEQTQFLIWMWMVVVLTASRNQTLLLSTESWKVCVCVCVRVFARLASMKPLLPSNTTVPILNNAQAWHSHVPLLCFSAMYFLLRLSLLRAWILRHFLAPSPNTTINKYKVNLIYFQQQPDSWSI